MTLRIRCSVVLSGKLFYSRDQLNDISLLDSDQGKKQKLWISDITLIDIVSLLGG